MGLLGDKTFLGFGFGPIQSGLFLREAFRSGNFSRMVVAEIMPEMVRAVKDADGHFFLNTAYVDRIDHELVGPIEIYDPREEKNDLERLIDAIAQADEIATAVPSVAFYKMEDRGSIHRVIAEGLKRKKRRNGPPCVVYAAENHNHAAEILEQYVGTSLPQGMKRWMEAHVQFLNTVIGKMSQVVADPEEIKRRNLKAVAPGIDRAFLVESFNRILITQIQTHLEIKRGIEVFEEKSDLLPFEEAKLYGHNATHALIGYIGKAMGLELVSDMQHVPGFEKFIRDAFLLESGDALVRKHAGIDPQFTGEGYEEFADDLLQRMVNPFLADRIDRIIRDPERKLGWEDRLVGTMRVALENGVIPERYALGAAAALDLLAGHREPTLDVGERLGGIWKANNPNIEESGKIVSLIENAFEKIQTLHAVGVDGAGQIFLTI